MQPKKLFSLLLCMLLCMSGVCATEDTSTDSKDAASALEAQAAQVPVVGLAPNTPTLHSLSAALLCAENGQLLLDKGADARLAPASITKLMTALVVLQNVPDLSATTTVSDTAVHSIERNSTHIALDAGEVVTLHDMMGAMLVESANDASNVLAEYVGGTLEGFADMMNDSAAALGCKDTHFVNANGLDDPNHYTTAHDMALITQALVQYPAFFEYAGARTFTIPPTNKQAEPRNFGTKQNFVNPNSKWYDENVLGGKNGWTTNAHHTLVTVKRVDDVTLIAVAMCDTTKLNALTDVAAMLQYGYDQFHAVTLPAADQARAAQQAYPNADIDALSSTLVLLPKDMQAGDLSLACAGDESAAALQVQAGEKTLVSVPLSMLSASAPASGMADGALSLVPKEEAPVSSLQTALQWALAAGAAAAALFTILLVYRGVRIRRQRRRIRTLRQREAMGRRRPDSDRFDNYDD